MKDYAHYWELIKEHKELKLKCYSSSVYTVQRMIKKKKDRDTAFKFSQAEQGIKWRLTFRVVSQEQDEKVTLHFVLTPYPFISGDML